MISAVQAKKIASVNHDGVIIMSVCFFVPGIKFWIDYFNSNFLKILLLHSVLNIPQKYLKTKHLKS